MASTINKLIRSLIFKFINRILTVYDRTELIMDIAGNDLCIVYNVRITSPFSTLVNFKGGMICNCEFVTIPMSSEIVLEALNDYS